MHKASRTLKEAAPGPPAQPEGKSREGAGPSEADFSVRDLAAHRLGVKQ